jgi:hypothetical protein
MNGEGVGNETSQHDTRMKGVVIAERRKESTRGRADVVGVLSWLCSMPKGRDGRMDVS